jgi:pimeloyl-ACP methyl ester carboxylesterase
VHGLFVDHQLWMPVIDKLSRTHRCLAPDLPLGSHSVPMHSDADLSPAGMARLAADFIAALELNDVTLVGNDSGGVISQLTVADHPARIARLVLTNCDGLEVFPPPGFEYLGWLPLIPGAMYVVSQAMYRLPALRRGKTAFGGLTKRPLADALLKQWVTPSAKSGAIRRDSGKFARGANKRVTLAVAERLPKFPGPALLLWGEDDPFFTLDLAGRLKNCFSDARLERIPDAKTFVSLDQPEKVAAAIAEFARTDRRVQNNAQQAVGAKV